MSGSLLEVSTLYFIGTTFAVNGGFYYTNIEEKGRLRSNKSDSYKINGNALTTKIGLGNFWSWKFGLTLGCEWVGVAFPPLFSSYSVTGTSTANITAGKDRIDALKKNGVLQLLNVKLGYQF